MFNTGKIINQKGFTLMELMIVIVIMTIVYAISMGSYANMGKKTDLENTVYSLALSIREVQYYGINKKLKDDDFSDEDPYPFGIHLDKDKKNQLVVFTDNISAGVFDNIFADDCEGVKVECQQIIALPKDIKIKSIQFWDNGSGSWGDEEEDFGKINILFKRPDPDAKIINETDVNVLKSKIKIIIQDYGESYCGGVTIGAAGDISVSKEICS